MNLFRPKPCWVLTLLLLAFLPRGYAQQAVSPLKPMHPDTLAARKWADSVLNRLDLDEKIGQLFMVAAYSNRDQQHVNEIRYLIQEYGLGGLIMMQGDPASQVNLLNAYQSLAKVPLLISQDAEWGLSMRLKQTLRFPYNMTLGAIRDDSLLYQLGREFGMELRRVGVHVNFAPVVDINNNAANPVINYRSFGENKYKVARKGILLSQGMQDYGVLACAKHFPGHGDTDSDSHYGLPLITHDKTRLDTLELYPFVKLAQAGIASMMVAHLSIPALDPTPNLASTLSPLIVDGLLRKQLGFSGLIFTDALNMQGVTKYYQPGEVDLKALLAGNDVLLFSEDVPTAVKAIHEAIDTRTFDREELDRRVRKILMAKYRVDLAHRRPISTQGLKEDLHTNEAIMLRRKLYEAAITLAKNENQLIPLRKLENRKIAYVQIGGRSENEFDNTLIRYGDVARFYLPAGFNATDRARMMRQLAEYNTVIVGIMGMNQQAQKSYGITQEMQAFLEALDKTPAETVLTVFGSPYSLRYFGKEEAILVAYEEVEDALRAAAMAIFGGIRIDGELPVSASPDFPEGTGDLLLKPIRFGFALPEQEGMDSGVLVRIDSIADYYIRKRAMPGCAILVARDNQIVYAKGFGHDRYGETGAPIDPFRNTYDLASLTKVTATTVSVMRLYDERRLALDEPIKTYLPELTDTRLATLTPRRLLQHNAGLPSWIPFYLETYATPARKMLDPKYYSYAPTPVHTLAIAPELYAVPSVRDSLWKRVKAIVPRNTTRVRYSDVGMIILARVVEAIVGEPLDVYAARTFYQPLGMDHTFFNPQFHGNPAFCPPTEADTIWRQAIIQGFVNDQTSALMGGVAGHAGLFANVYDLTKLMTMIVNEGTYGDQALLTPASIGLFTRRQLDYSRKGLGWDKPEIGAGRPSPVSANSSAATFGHTGFTGTAVWVDPAERLIYVFLSNRTYPYPGNRLLLRENVRTVIMDQLYESMRRFEQKKRFSSRMN